jgi:hypothetical protein
MKLFLLKRLGPVGWDEVRGVVIRATSSIIARRLAAASRGDEGSEPWMDPEQTMCKVLDNEGAPGIILQDFNQG